MAVHDSSKVGAWVRFPSPAFNSTFMSSIISALLVVFFFIFLGWLGVRIRLFKKEESRTLNNFVYYLAFPALLFVNLYKTDWRVIANRNFIVVNGLVVILGFLAAYLFCFFRKYPTRKRIIVATAVVLGNTAYLGIPLNTFLFGQPGLVFASLVASWQILLILVMAIFLFHLREANFWRSIAVSLADTSKTPLILAVLLGLLAAYFHLPLPKPAHLFVETLGQATLAAALLALGIFLYGLDWRREIKASLGLSLATLIFLPLLALGLLKIWPLDNPWRAVTIIQAAAPLAVLNFVLAQKFRVEEKLIASAAFISTVLSFFSYLFWIWMMA